MKNAKLTARKILAVLAVVAIFLSATVMSVSASGNVSLDKVNEAKQGVFLVVYCYPDPIDPTLWWNATIGTGFLVNDDTIITCYHVIHPENDMTPEGIAFMEDMISHDPNYKNKVEIRVYYKSGAYYTATEVANFANSSFDFTAIRLSSPIYGYRTLTLCDDIETSLISPNPVYALGFPYIDTFFAHNYIDSYTSRDVDTKDGIMSKFYNYEGGEVISHSAATASGMSGGPLLNGAGQVVGVNASRILGTDSFSYAVKISDVIDSLDITGISYTAEHGGASGSSSETTTAAPSTDNSGSEEDTTDAGATDVVVDFSSLTSAIANAESKVNSTTTKYEQAGLDALKTEIDSAKAVKNNTSATQSEVDAATSKLNAAIGNLKEKQSGLSLPLIIGIAAAAVVIIAVIIIVVIVSSKKKNNEDDSYADPYTAYPTAGGFSQSAPAPAPSFTPNNTYNDGGAETGVLASSSNETTVLGAGANETTVLNSAPYAKLARKSNNEIVQVGATPFVIGKERRKVNYCIDDNSTISRSHAQIVKNGTKVCVVDLGSKNGTFVNGVKCNPNAAVEVKSNDKIVLSDEEFVVTVL